MEFSIVLVKVDWLNKLIENMWPYLDTVRMPVMMFGLFYVAFVFICLQILLP